MVRSVLPVWYARGETITPTAVKEEELYNSAVPVMGICPLIGGV